MNRSEMQVYATVQWRWAIRVLDPKDESDKKSIEHAERGVGYVVVRKPTRDENYYIVAYRHCAGPLPEGHEFASSEQIKKLNELDEKHYFNGNSEARKKKRAMYAPAIKYDFNQFKI